MSTTYKVIVGDTFESIARKNYGSEIETDRVARANPGVVEPLTPGITIVVPVLPEAPKDAQQLAASDGPNEVAVLIDGQRFRFWSDIRLSLSLDSVDSVELIAPFEPDEQVFRDTFVPFTYRDLVVTVGGIPLFTGTAVAIDPVVENQRRIVSLGAYATPGVLSDCTPPASAYPLEFDGQGLQEIATTLATPFGIEVVFDAPQGAIFDRVAMEPGSRILSFLAKLAKQRNLVIGNNNLGALVFTQSVAAGPPVARLSQGSSPVLSVSPFFNPQEYYSHVTGLEPVITGLGGSQYTVRNTRLTGVVRPLTYSVPDTLNADVKTAVEAKISRMYGNMASYSVQVSTWRDSAGQLWTPNTTITLIAPGAMVYSEYSFILRSVILERTANDEVAILDLIIPGAFSGVLPEVLPWD